MYYYYDVLLNFTSDDELFSFYEWEESDQVEFIKKIPIFRTSNICLLDNLQYKIKYETTLVEQIKNKTIVKSKHSLENTFLDINQLKNCKLTPSQGLELLSFYGITF